MKKSSSEIINTIAIVVPAVAREGITKQVANQILGLKKKNVKVCLIVLAVSELQVLEEYGVSITSMPVLQLHQTTSYLSPGAFWGALLLTRPILRFLKKNEVESVIAHAPYAHFVMRLAKLTGRVVQFRLFPYFHGLQYSEFPVSSWKRRMVNELNKWLAKHYDHAHISVSEAVKQEIADNLIRHPDHTVIYNSLGENYSWDTISEQVWQQLQPLLKKADGRYKLLLPNRIDANKGQLFFLGVLEAFFKSRVATTADIAVFIVGDGPDRELIEEQVQVKCLANTVTLTGALPNAIVQKLMQNVDLVVVPSRMEGMPFAVLEALAAKRVILASRAGGISEIIRNKETGFLFEPGDVQDCLNELVSLYQHRTNHLVNLELVERDLQEKFSTAGNTERLLHLLASNKL